MTTETQTTESPHASARKSGCQVRGLHGGQRWERKGAGPVAEYRGKAKKAHARLMNRLAGHKKDVSDDAGKFGARTLPGSMKKIGA